MKWWSVIIIKWQSLAAVSSWELLYEGISLSVLMLWEWRVFVCCTVHSGQHIKLIADKSSCLPLTRLSSAMQLSHLLSAAACHKSWLLCMFYQNCMVCVCQHYDWQCGIEMWQPWWSPMTGVCCRYHPFNTCVCVCDWTGRVLVVCTYLICLSRLHHDY